MLELDLVLGPFAEHAYSELGEADRSRYRALMECEDQELFGWFLRREPPRDPELAVIVAKILDYHAA
jgi:antitoxin CptB